MRTAAILVLTLALSGCGLNGMARAAHGTDRMFDKYGCLSRQLKGEEPCRTEDAQPRPDGAATE
jgi:hypothetical protein